MQRGGGTPPHVVPWLWHLLTPAQQPVRKHTVFFQQFQNLLNDLNVCAGNQNRVTVTFCRCCEAWGAAGVTPGYHTPLEASAARGKWKNNPFGQGSSLILGIEWLPLPHPRKDLHGSHLPGTTGIYDKILSFKSCIIARVARIEMS